MKFILNTCQAFMPDSTHGVVGMVTLTLALEWYAEEVVTKLQDANDWRAEAVI